MNSKTTEAGKRQKAEGQQVQRPWDKRVCAPFKALQASQKAFPKEVTPKPRPQGLDGATEESILARRKSTREVLEAREQNESRNSKQFRTAEAESGSRRMSCEQIKKGFISQLGFLNFCPENNKLSLKSLNQESTWWDLHFKKISQTISDYRGI